MISPQLTLSVRRADMTNNRFLVIAFIIWGFVTGALGSVFNQLRAEDRQRGSRIIAAACISAVLIAGVAALIRRRRYRKPSDL